MNDKTGMSITKWLKPVGSTFTVEATLDGDELIPKADPKILFDGNGIKYQTQYIKCGVENYSGKYIRITQGSNSNISIIEKEEPTETPEDIAAATDTTASYVEYPLYDSEKIRIFITYKRIS